MGKTAPLPPNRTKEFLQVMKEIFVAYLAGEVSLSRLRLWLYEEIEANSRRQPTEGDDESISLQDRVFQLLEKLRGIVREVRRAEEMLTNEIIDYGRLWLAPGEQAAIECSFLMIQEEHEIRRLCKAASEANPGELWPYLTMYCLSLLVSDQPAQEHFASLAAEHGARERDLQRFRLAFSIVE